MVDRLDFYPFGSVLSLCRIDDSEIIVLGSNYIKIFSLPAKKETKNAEFSDENRNCVLTPDKRILLVSTGLGIKKFSLPQLELVEQYSSGSDVNVLSLITRSNILLFSINEQILQLNLNDGSVKDLKDSHEGRVLCIEADQNEEFFWSSGEDRILKKWDTVSCKVLKFVQLSSPASTLLILNDSKSILAGLKHGSVAEIDLEDLSMKRSVDLHSDSVTKIWRMNNGFFLSGSHDGFLKFPFSNIEPIKLDNKRVNCIDFLSTNRYLLTFDEGIELISFSYLENYSNVTNEPTPANLDASRPNLFKKKQSFISTIGREVARVSKNVSKDSSKIITIVDNFLGNNVFKAPFFSKPKQKLKLFDKVFHRKIIEVRHQQSNEVQDPPPNRTQTSSDPNLITILQLHLFKLITSCHFDPSNFTCLSLSLLSSPRSIQRSYHHLGGRQTRKRIFRKNCFLDLPPIKNGASIPEACLVVLARKFRVLGTLINEENPFNGFIVKKVRRGNWIFTMIDKTNLNEKELKGPATVDLVNGSLTCFINEGQLLINSDFQMKMKVNGEEKLVSSIGPDGTVTTSDRKIYLLHFKTNKICHLNY